MTLNFRESEKARQKEEDKADKDHVSGDASMKLCKHFSKNHSFQPFKIWMGQTLFDHVPSGWPQ